MFGQCQIRQVDYWGHLCWHGVWHLLIINYKTPPLWSGMCSYVPRMIFTVFKHCLNHAELVLGDTTPVTLMSSGVQKQWISCNHATATTSAWHYVTRNLKKIITFVSSFCFFSSKEFSMKQFSKIPLNFQNKINSPSLGLDKSIQLSIKYDPV